MSISFLSVLSNVQLYCGRLIISFHPSSDLLTTTTSRDRLFSPLVANQVVVHLWRRSILCNFPLRKVIHFSRISPTAPTAGCRLSFIGNRFQPLWVSRMNRFSSNRQNPVMRMHGRHYHPNLALLGFTQSNVMYCDVTFEHY